MPPLPSLYPFPYIFLPFTSHTSIVDYIAYSVLTSLKILFEQARIGSSNEQAKKVAKKNGKWWKCVHYDYKHRSTTKRLVEKEFGGSY